MCTLRITQCDRICHDNVCMKESFRKIHHLRNIDLAQFLYVFVIVRTGFVCVGKILWKIRKIRKIKIFSFMNYFLKRIREIRLENSVNAKKLCVSVGLS